MNDRSFRTAALCALFLMTSLATVVSHAQPGNREVEELNAMLDKGETEEVKRRLPEMISTYQNHPGVIYLQGRVATDGVEAAKHYQSILDNYPQSEWADDALHRLYQYYYAMGLYKTAELKHQQLKKEYPNSPYLAGASGSAAGSTAGATGATTGTGDAKTGTTADTSGGKGAKTGVAAGAAGAGAAAGGGSGSGGTGSTGTGSSGSGSSGASSSGASSSSAPSTGTASAGTAGAAKTVSPGDDTVKLADREADASNLPYSVQTGAFSTAENAMKQKTFFEENGYTAEVANRVRGGRSLFLVWVGRYATSADAGAVRDEIRTRYQISPIVIER